MEAVDLRNKDLKNVNLEGCSFIGANLSGADLSGADLRNTDFREANLKDTKIIGADLEGAEGLQVFNIGDNNTLAFTYTYDGERRYQIGDFNGNYAETIEKIREENGDNSRYERIINAYNM